MWGFTYGVGRDDRNTAKVVRSGRYLGMGNWENDGFFELAQN